MKAGELTLTRHVSGIFRDDAGIEAEPATGTAPEMLLFCRTPDPPTLTIRKKGADTTQKARADTTQKARIFLCAHQWKRREEQDKKLVLRFSIMNGNSARSFSDRSFFKTSPGSWTSAPSGHGCLHRNACFFPGVRAPDRSFLPSDVRRDIRVDVRGISGPIF